MKTSILRGAVAALALVTSLSPMAPVRAESEAVSNIDIWGQLIELSSTEVPTTIVVRTDPTGTWTDYSVDIDADTDFGTKVADTTAMTDWITGDWVRVKGTRNENTGVVTADLAINTSIDLVRHRGLNGWITAIGDDSISVQWNGKTYEIGVTESTRMVVPPVNPASLSDFRVGDRVRMRMERDTDDARIIVALRRGDHIYLKARTRGFSARIDDINESGSTIEATLLANPHLRIGDVNNLVGTEGEEVVIAFDSNTTFVRRFSGETDISEFQDGDRIFVVGRVNDDGTISARLIKDENIWRQNVERHAGEVASIDTDANEIVLTNVYGVEGEVTVSYGDDTAFVRRGAYVDEDDFRVGDHVRVRGTARTDSDGNVTVSEVDTVVILPGRSTDESEPLPDLAVTGLALDDGMLGITLKNVGTVDAEGTVSVYVWIDGDLAWTYSSSTLSDQDFLEAGGESLLSPQTIALTSEVRACVDYGDEVEERNESNNCKENTLIVP